MKIIDVRSASFRSIRSYPWKAVDDLAIEWSPVLLCALVANTRGLTRRERLL